MSQKNLNIEYETNSNYDINTGNYEYQFYRYCYYKADISAQLIPGLYHLAFTDVDGETSNKNYTFNAIVDLPFIPANSYSYYIDQDGNFIWQWKMPNIDYSISTSIKVGVFISIYGDKNEYLGELFIYVPTQLGKMVVPKDTFNQLLTMGKKFILGALIKTSDNNNRAYSNGVLLPSLIPQPTACVATLDSGLSLHLPYISYDSDVSLLADFIYDYNPLYPNLMIFKLTNASVIDKSLFSCTASSLNNNLSIHIPNVLLPDETTHLWVDLEYSAALSTDGKLYWVVSNCGLLPTPTPTPFPTPTPNPTQTCTGYTYSEWSACGITNTQTRTIIAGIPSGCSGGATPVTTQACTFTPLPPGDMCQNANAMLQGNWYKNMGSTTYMFDQISFASANNGYPEGYFTGISGGTKSIYIYNIDDTCASFMLFKDLGNGTVQLYRTYNYVVSSSILKLEVAGKIAYYCKDSPNSCSP